MATDIPRPRGAPTFLFVSGGRVVLVASWFLATRLLANALGPAGFGLYFICQSAIRVLAGCIGDPIDMAVMREAPLLLRSDRPRAVELIRSAFWLRVFIAGLLLLIAMALPRLASGLIFASPAFKGLAILTVAGVLGDFLLRSALGFFQVSERFGPFLAVDAVWQIGRVIVVVILVQQHKLTAPLGVALYVVAPYIAFVAAWPLLPRDLRRLAPPHDRHVAGILKYSGWIVLGLAMAALYDRLDVFILRRYRGEFEVGIYGGAVFLATIPDFLDGIIQTVLAPRVAPAHADGSFNQLQRSYLLYAFPLGIVAGCGSIFFARWGIHRFFSADFSGCIPAFQILIVSTLFNLVFTPLPAALVNFVAPKRLVMFTGVGLISVAAGSLLFIPHYGATGAAMTMLGARVLVGVLIIIEAWRLSRNQAEEPSSGLG